MAEWTIEKANEELTKILSDMKEDMSAGEANKIIVRLQDLRSNLLDDMFDGLCKKIEGIENKLGNDLISEGLEEIRSTTSLLQGLTVEIRSIDERATRRVEQLKVTAIQKVGEIASGMIDSYNDIKALVDQREYAEASIKIEAVINRLSELTTEDELKAALGW